MLPRVRLTLLVLALFAAGSSCRRRTEAPAPQEAAGVTLTSEQALRAKLDDWRRRFESQPDLNGKLASEFARDTSIPPYESLQFAVEHFEHPGSRAGHFVRMMRQTMDADLAEAMRCYEVIHDQPHSDASFHALGLELGKRMPAEGLPWLEKFDNSRKRYFDASAFGGGFADYVGRHPLEEVEPLFERCLESPLFAGEPYDPKQAGSGKGSRMRESMALRVLEAWARAGRLDEGLATRLESKVPAKCVPALRSYPLLGWPLDRLLAGFDLNDFPEASRQEAVTVARHRLEEEATLAQAVAWAEGIGDPALSSKSVRFIHRSFLLKAGDDEVIRILESIANPALFRYAAEVALERADKEKKNALKQRITDLKRNRP